MVRTRSEASRLLPNVRAEILATAPDIAIDSIRTIEEVLAAQTAQPRFNGIVIGLIATLALLLAMIGVFGVAATWVGQLMWEIGVRMAMGAQRRAVMAMILGQALLVGACGNSRCARSHAAPSEFAFRNRPGRSGYVCRCDLDNPGDYSYGGNSASWSRGTGRSNDSVSR